MAALVIKSTEVGLAKEIEMLRERCSEYSISHTTGYEPEPDFKEQHLDKNNLPIKALDFQGTRPKISMSCLLQAFC